MSEQIAAVIFALCLVAFGLLDFACADGERRLRMPGNWLLNFALFVVGQVVLIILPFTSLIVATYSIDAHIGLFTYLPELPWGVKIGVWGLASTFLFYAMHYAEHRMAMLWAFHRVHHCDEALGVSTAIRHHPVEDILSAITNAALALALAPSPSMILWWYLGGMMVDFFNHSRLPLPEKLSTALEWVIVTPRIHGVHHSDYRPQTDSNFGGTFTFWDRIFGTFRRDEPRRFGLDDLTLVGKATRDFDTLLAEPFVYAWRKIRRANIS